MRAARAAHHSRRHVRPIEFTTHTAARPLRKALSPHNKRCGVRGWAPSPIAHPSSASQSGCVHIASDITPLSNLLRRLAQSKLSHHPPPAPAPAPSARRCGSGPQIKFGWGRGHARPASHNAALRSLHDSRIRTSTTLAMCASMNGVVQSFVDRMTLLTVVAKYTPHHTTQISSHRTPWPHPCMRRLSLRRPLCSPRARAPVRRTSSRCGMRRNERTGGACARALALALHDRV